MQRVVMAKLLDRVKAWHLFEWSQSFTVVMLYFVTAIALTNNWLVTQRIQFRSGIALNIAYAEHEECKGNEFDRL